MMVKRMKKKTKTNSVLEKKLEELESLLETITLIDNLDLYRDIELRFIFAQTLLAAEISSRPTDVEGEEDNEDTLKLACMAKRLNELDEAFKNQLYVRDNGSVIEPETNDGVVDGETGSVYSWVESCPDEFGKAAAEEEEDAEQWPLFQDGSSGEKKETTLPVVAAADEEEVVVVKERKEKGRLGFGLLVCFGLIGLVCGMISLFGDYLKEDDFFLTPT